MAASKRPSFLKRQKEQARVARAAEKREAKRQRKLAKANGLAPADEPEFDTELEPLDAGEEPKADEA